MNRNDIVGYLILNERIKINNRPYWNCTCKLCGNNKNIREDSIKTGKTISDGCYKKTTKFSEKNKSVHKIEDLSGNIYGELIVIKLAEHNQSKQIMWTCLCSCGRYVDVWSANLKNGNTTTCGDYKAHREKKLKEVWTQTLDDLTGKIYGDWLVKHRDKTTQPTRWICECQNCGTIKSVLGSSLKTGKSTSCGCKKHNCSLTGKTAGRWTIGKRSKRKRPNGRFCTTYLCKCKCGTERYVDESRLLNGTSLSCGCIKSKSNEYIANILKENGYRYTPEYKFEELRGPGNGLLRFDFAIHDHDGNIVCLLEYQGEQHYKDDTEFGKQQREITDPQKREFCKNKNIKLFEIKYTDNIDAKLEYIFTHITC